jgi:hypothetical protein
MTIKRFLCATVALSALSLSAAHAAPVNLITNGDFESGSLAGWTVSNTGYPDNSFYSITNGANAPVSGNATALNSAGGNFVAVSDQNGGGGEALSQTFTKAANATSLILSFDWFDNTHSAFYGTAIDGSQQAGRVDILNAGAGAFDVTTGVVQNLLLNAGVYTSFGSTTGWEHISFDLSALTAGVYQLRFASGQSSFYQEFGVDNVSLTGAAVPEPGTIALLGLGLFGFAVSRRKSANNKNA